MRSSDLPGIFSNMSSLTLGANLPWFCMTNHLSAILMGVVKHEVNKSAGSSGFIGSSWVAEQAASWMQFLMAEGDALPTNPPWPLPCCKDRKKTTLFYVSFQKSIDTIQYIWRDRFSICTWARTSRSCCSANCSKQLTMMPALEQSHT